jgi:hypothetical protein
MQMMQMTQKDRHEWTQYDPWMTTTTMMTMMMKMKVDEVVVFAEPMLAHRMPARDGCNVQNALESMMKMRMTMMMMVEELAALLEKDDQGLMDHVDKVHLMMAKMMRMMKMREARLKTFRAAQCTTCPQRHAYEKLNCKRNRVSQ